MPLPSAKIPDNHSEVLAIIKQLESSKAETPQTKEMCCAEGIYRSTMKSMVVYITSMGAAMRNEYQLIDGACKKAGDKKKIVEIPHPEIAKTKKATDKQEKLL